MLKRLSLSIICVLTLAVGGQEPDSPPDYQVELLLVRNLNPNVGTEVFPLDIEITDEASTDDERPVEPFAALTADALTLTDMVPKIARSRNFRVVGHTGWTQPGYTREEAKRKLVLTSAQTGEAVSGSATLSRERYLRLAFDLTLLVDGQSHRLQTQRRMISRQVHYFDHPYFGVIAKITPL
ncbi:MAG: CsiV family protein [Pseudomonadota bacterium]